MRQMLEDWIWYAVSTILSISWIVVGCTVATPVQPTSSPISTPQVATFASALPTPNPDAGTIVGRLVRQFNQQPIASTVVFLEKTTPEHTVPPIIYAPPNDQPHATTNALGEFVLANVPSGEYVVIVFLPPATVEVVTDAGDNHPRLISAKSNDVIDLGNISVPE